MNAKRPVSAALGCAGAACGGGDPTTTSKCLAANDDGKKADPVQDSCSDATPATTRSMNAAHVGSSGIAIVGDGKFNGGQNFTDPAGTRVVVNDDRRRTGPTAVGGRQVEVPGIGDRCAQAASPACAKGLTCRGICTKACSADAECGARADGCALPFQLPHVCVVGTSTRGCGSDFSEQAWVGGSSAGVAQGCSLR